MRITNQCEVDLAIALVKCIQRGLKSCIHYDTTQRSGIPGDFVSLVMSFSNLESFRFMPLYFAYEDRENIIRYFVESYQRLSICSTEVQGHPVSAASLWEKTDAIMTDAVAKNLKIEDGIAQQLGSDHIPKHLLCKSHTVEALDDSNIKVLAEIEQSCKFRQNLEAMFPAIKRFTRGSLSVVVTGIITILNWISHHKSALPTNVADLFDKVCEEEGRTRTFSLYQQRRFAKLGYLAGAILDAMDLLVILLDRVPDQNLHVESVRIFVECEFFSTALACLSYFQHNVTFPFLMLVQFSSQKELCNILPKLKNYLRGGKTDTLAEFKVARHQYQVKDLTSDLELLILKKMCFAASNRIERQCDREYNPTPGPLAHPPRATIICQETEDELEGLPTNNLICERDLSHFDRKSKLVAKNANKKFRATNLRCDMTQLHADPQLTEVAKKIGKQLAEREAAWHAEQKCLQALHLEKKFRKAEGSCAYQNKVLDICKTWGGPCVTVNQLNAALQRAPDEKVCVTNELTYYRLTHQLEYKANRQLFRVRGITHEEKLENLTDILSTNEDHNLALRQISLPSNADVLNTLQPNDGNTQDQPNNHILEEMLNKIKPVIWISADNRKHWFLGCVVSYDGNKPNVVEVDHLVRIDYTHDLWKYPTKEDKCDVELNQLVPITPEYEWEVHARYQRLVLKNHEEIDAYVENRSLPL